MCGQLHGQCHAWSGGAKGEICSRGQRRGWGCGRRLRAGSGALLLPPVAAILGFGKIEWAGSNIHNIVYVIVYVKIIYYLLKGKIERKIKTERKTCSKAMISKC